MYVGLIFLCFFIVKPISSDLLPIVEWKQLDFLFPNENERQLAINEGRFNASTCVILDADVHYRGNYRHF